MAGLFLINYVDEFKHTLNFIYLVKGHIRSESLFEAITVL